MAVMPFRYLFVGMGQRQNPRLGERCADNLETDRQAGAREAARNRDRRQAENVKRRGIACGDRLEGRTFLDRNRRARHRGCDQQVYI
jgi:hypothetical protein